MKNTRVKGVNQPSLSEKCMLELCSSFFLELELDMSLIFLFKLSSSRWDLCELELDSTRTSRIQRACWPFRAGFVTMVVAFQVD
jgi:hypothetical protein